MNTKIRFNCRLAFLLGLALLVLTTACAQDTGTGGPRAWIDTPLDGESVPASTPVSVVSHQYAKEGVAEVLLTVDGQPYQRIPPKTPGAFTQAEHQWKPEQEGNYILQVKAYTKDGKESSTAAVRVKVVKPGAAETGRKATFTPTVPGTADLAIDRVEAVIAGYKNEIPFCNTRVVYRNAGTAAIPREFTIQFHFNGTPQLANTTAGGLPPGASAEAIFVYQFIGSPYIGINLDSTNVIAESDETNNAFANARLCGSPPGVTPTATPTNMASQTNTPTATIALPPPPLTRTPTPTPTRTRTNTPWPPASVNFRADATQLEKGKCTMLRWDVENATSVSLDGAGVVGHGTRQVCPAQTTTYTLQVQAPRGNVQRQVTITVTTPRDTTPPPVPSPQVPANGLAINCKTSQTLAWLPVKDDSGIAGYYVKLERQITANNWQSLRGWGPVTGKQVTADVQCGVKYRWAVRAQDTAGNYSDWSAWSYFSINLH